MYQHIPNALSVFRIVVAIPLLILALASPESPACHVAALLLMGCVIVSDWLDGRLARRWNVVSPRGAHLDPIADKFVELLMYAAFLLLYRSWALAVLTAGITLRHVIVTAMRKWAAQAHGSIAARRSGKIRTALSFGFVFILLARVPYRTGQPHWVIGYANDIPVWALEATVWTLLALTFYSLFDYLRAHGAVIHHRVK